MSARSISRNGTAAFDLGTIRRRPAEVGIVRRSYWFARLRRIRYTPLTWYPPFCSATRHPCQKDSAPGLHNRFILQSKHPVENRSRQFVAVGILNRGAMALGWVRVPPRASTHRLERPVTVAKLANHFNNPTPGCPMFSYRLLWGMRT